MKIALSVYQERIAPVFDVAGQVLVVDVKPSGLGEGVLVQTNETTPELKILKLVELEVKTLICGAISRPMLWLAKSHGIRVIDFIAGDVKRVMNAYRDHALQGCEFSMPGCRRQNRFRHGQGPQRRGFSR